MPKRSPPRVLIVDDHERFRSLACDIFKWFGIRTLQAATGKEALVLARSKKPDIIVLDAVLDHGLSGEQTLLALKTDSRTATIPVIALSAHDEASEHRFRFKQGGADSFILKDEAFDPVEAEPPLIRRIKALTVRPPAA